MGFFTGRRIGPFGVNASSRGVGTSFGIGPFRWHRGPGGGRARSIRLPGGFSHWKRTR